MNKEPQQTIIVRSQLGNKPLKGNSEEERKVYHNKQRNMCVILLKKPNGIVFES